MNTSALQVELEGMRIDEDVRMASIERQSEEQGPDLDTKKTTQSDQHCSGWMMKTA